MRKLNFGCGPDIREGWDNVDIQKIQKSSRALILINFLIP